jgi:hypothetical protein
MAISRAWWRWSVVSWFLVMGFAASAKAVSWSDNFNDGSIIDGTPVTWITNLGSPDHEPGSFFPSIYDASSGDLLLDPDDDSPTGSSSAFVPVGFANTYIRTQGKVIPDPNDPANDGGNLVLTGRIDAATLSGYIMYFDSAANLNIQYLLGGTPTDIVPGSTYDAPFNALSEVVIELNIVGNQLSGYAWLADDPNGKPASPQISITDVDNVFTAGIAGIAYDEDEPFTSGVYRYVSAQDTPFVDGVPGDYNNNGVVDAADYVLWRNGGTLQNEVATPGSVTTEDYDAWRARFGNGGAGAGAGNVAAAAVPEPAGLMLLFLGLAASLVVGRTGPTTGRS